MNVSILWLLLCSSEAVCGFQHRGELPRRAPHLANFKGVAKKKSNSRFSSLRKREHMNQDCFLLEGQISSKDFKGGSESQIQGSRHETADYLCH